MPFFELLFSYGQTALNFGHTIFWAVVVLGVLIFIHELGHHLVAKMLGIGVSHFSLGFGRRLWGFQWGETEYQVSLIPLGGYVKLVGEDPEASAEDPEEQAGAEELEDPEKSFYLRPVSHRMAVIAAGPLFNILFALVLSWILHVVGVPVPGTWVGKVLPDSPAQAAGLERDDRIVAIGGKSVNKWTRLVSIIRRNAGKQLVLRVDRKGGLIELPITPTSKSTEGKELGFGRIGIQMSPKAYTVRYGPIESVGYSLERNYYIIRLTVKTLYGILTRTIPAEIGGPIRIAGLVGQQAKRGLAYVVSLAILLSLNLAILNLLPIPILDGGHLTFLTIEALRGKPLSLRIREMSMQVGMVLIVGLMLFATYKDSLYLYLQWTQ